MVDYKVAIGTTLLLVDDDVRRLQLQAFVLKMSGFTVFTAAGPIEAISLLVQLPARSVHIAILDYNMPVMNGCVLAEYLRARYMELKVILHSGAVDIPESEMTSVDVFVPKGDGVARLLEEITTLARLRATSFEAIMGQQVSLPPGG
jgi:DNA-binding NarL/FixJ family response regulator